MEDNISVDDKLLKAFHLMYDNFPEPVQLTHKSKKILAVNPAGLASGKEVGLFCSKLGPPESHKICLAHKALRENTSKWVAVTKQTTPPRKFVAFWLPVEGYPDFYVHFSCGNKIDYFSESGQ
jgi:hypothetical protein